MKIKLVAFDLDNTLTNPNNLISRDNADALRKLSRFNVQIALLSGKPSSYLLGVGRQLGIKNIILSGENGADIYFGNMLPPTKYIKNEISQDEKNELETIKKGLDDLGYEYYYQPNIVALTPFYYVGDKDAKNALYDFARYMKHKVESIDIYLHDDCVDFTPSSINKGKALLKIINNLNSKLSEDEKITNNSIMVVGDSSNDVPMFDLNFRNVIIGTSLKEIKGEREKYVGKVINNILKGYENNE